MTAQDHPVPIEILLVEDNPGDVRLTREAMRKVKVANNLHHVADGEEALRFLLKEGEYEASLTPDLVILDLNLPGKSGREVLAAIKAHPTLKIVPVAVLTSSSAEEDILRSYALAANCYIVKPLDVAGFYSVVQAIDNFWMSIVKLPKV